MILKKKNIIILVLLIMNVISSFKMLYSLSLLDGIESFIRVLISLIIILMLIGFLITYFRLIIENNKQYIKYIFTTIIYCLILLIGSNFILKIYKSLSKISSNTNVYSVSIVVLKETSINNIKQIDNGKIGIINDYSSYEGNLIPKEIIKNENIDNKIIEYDGYSKLLEALYNKEITYAFLPTTYVEKFKNLDDKKYERLEEETKIIYTKEKEIKQSLEYKKITKEPFSILIMGVDSEKENLKKSYFNGDSLMLLTFNPNTLNTTIMSIPRDSYVPITCFNNTKSKITHAAIQGEDCIIKTIEKLIDIKIDYYLKINFKGFVKVIDSLGGVEVDVPYSFCEQDSNRRWGSNTIYVEKGLQKLNGEQALALSRNRKNNTSKCSSKWTDGYRSDFVRGENQQLVLRAILNKLKDIDSINEITNLLDNISNSMETNLSTEQILSLYNIGKDIIVRSSNTSFDELIGFKRLKLNGYDDRLYDEEAKMNLYEYVLYDESIKEVSKEMKTNLGLIKPELIKEFSFDINEDYEEKIIGVGNFNRKIDYDK